MLMLAPCLFSLPSLSALEGAIARRSYLVCLPTESKEQQLLRSYGEVEVEEPRTVCWHDWEL